MILSNNCYLKPTCKKFQSRRCDCENSSEFFCPKLFKIDYLYNESLMTDIQRKHFDLHLDADGTDEEAFGILKSIQDNIETFVNQGNNLYIHSCTTGNGKTAWAIRLLQTYFETVWYKSELGCKGLFINVPRFLLSLKDSISCKNDYVDHIKSSVLDADIVVWDEVGVKALTPFEHEHLLSLINARIDSNKSNIYTSNLQPQDLREKLGDRLYSRVVNYSTNIEFFGQDKRSLFMYKK